MKVQIELTREECEIVANALWHLVKSLDDNDCTSRADRVWGIRNIFREALQQDKEQERNV